MKSKTISAVLMSGAGVVCLLAPSVRAEEVAPPSIPAAEETRPTLQISSEVAPDFLVPTFAPGVAPATNKATSSKATSSRTLTPQTRAPQKRAPQWIENPLLKAQTNRGGWINNSDVQLLDAPPQTEGFEIEILPAQPEPSLPKRLSSSRTAENIKTKNTDGQISVRTQEAAKIAVERAMLLEKAGVSVMAVAQLQRAVSLAPDDIASRRALAQWTSQHEQWPEAAAQWREVLYQLQTQSNVPLETAQVELWRDEATREMRAAQNQLLAFWQVPNVVTLGSDSKNPVAHSTLPVKLSSTIHVARTSTALANTTSQASAPAVAPMVAATPEPKAAVAKSAIGNVVAAPPPSQNFFHELHFDVLVNSLSKLRPPNAEKQNAEKQNATVGETAIAETNVALDSSREQARLLSMQRQQKWLNDIVHIEINGAKKIDG